MPRARRNTVAVGFAALAVCAPVLVPAQPADLERFEVASVKRDTSCGSQRGSTKPGNPGRLNLECQTLMGLMVTSYGVFADGKAISWAIPEITNAPPWATSDTYDIAAKAGADTAFPRMAGPMLRALLEDRFQLKIHSETKEAPVYLLTVKKNGVKLEPIQEGSCAPLDPNQPPPPMGRPAQNYCGLQTVKDTASYMTYVSRGITMKQFEIFLSRVMDRPVIDQTGLDGLYDIQFDFSPRMAVSTPGASTPPAAPDAPLIQDVLAEKLGLKLEAGRGPVRKLVVDHAERPGEN